MESKTSQESKDAHTRKVVGGLLKWAGQAIEDGNCTTAQAMWVGEQCQKIAQGAIDPIMTTNDIAKMTGKTPNAIRRIFSYWGVKATKIIGHPRSEVEKYIEKN